MRREQAEQAVWLFVKSGRDRTSPDGDHITPGPSPGGCGGVSTPQTMQPGLGPSYCGTHTTWRDVTRTYTSLLRWLRICCNHAMVSLNYLLCICVYLQADYKPTNLAARNRASHTPYRCAMDLKESGASSRHLPHSLSQYQDVTAGQREGTLKSVVYEDFDSGPMYGR